MLLYASGGRLASVFSNERGINPIQEKESVSRNVYEERVRRVGLNIPDMWKGDSRPKFVELFMPLLEGSVFSIKNNMTDSSAKILEVYRAGNPRRIMGMTGLKSMNMRVFFNPDLHAELQKKINY